MMPQWGNGALGVVVVWTDNTLDKAFPKSHKPRSHPRNAPGLQAVVIIAKARAHPTPL